MIVKEVRLLGHEKMENVIHLTEEEQINQQKKIEEEAKAEAAKRESEVIKEELIDLLGPEVVNKYYNDKLQYDRYCDKMLNRRAISKITNCDVLTRKGPITLKVYREDGTSEIIPNFKASDLHLGEWKEVMKASNKRLKSSVQYEDHLPGTVLNEPVLGGDCWVQFLSPSVFQSLEDWEVSSLQFMQRLQGTEEGPWLEFSGKKRLLYVKRNKAISLGNVTSKVGIEVHQLSLKDRTCQSKSDYSLYTKFDKGVFLALLVYVDDIIITGNNVSEIEKFKVFLKSKFMIKDLGKLKYFLGIEVIDTDKGICLNQRKYVLDLLFEYGMLACKPAKTPVMSKLVISNEACENDPLLENVTDYQKLMGKLIYLTNTRPDISYVVHCLSQFMHSPLTSHLRIAFKILRYLKSCPGLGIHIARTSGMFLNAYSDADWAKCIVTRKSVTGYCVFLNNSLVLWKSKKQNTISKSSIEAEYRALASVTSEVIWILNFLKDLQIENLLPVSLHCDKKVLKGVVKTVKVDYANQIADILTKGLDTIIHSELVKRLVIALEKALGPSLKIV
ncbi:ribonuclease H-like domain-containing protein [Tanacetum coccineum]